MNEQMHVTDYKDPTQKQFERHTQGQI